MRDLVGSVQVAPIGVRLVDCVVPLPIRSNVLRNYWYSTSDCSRSNSKSITKYINNK